MSQVIAFINFKGGVGKTANAVHIGTCLAADHNKRILIVVFDWFRRLRLETKPGPLINGRRFETGNEPEQE